MKIKKPKVSKFQKLLAQKVAVWETNPELSAKESYEFIKKYAGKDLDAAKMFIPMCINAQYPYDANEALMKLIGKEQKFKEILYMYLDLYSKFSDTPHEALFAALILNDVEDDKIELIKLIISLYQQTDQKEKAIELFDKAKEKFPDHFTESEIAQMYLHSEMPEYIEKGIELTKKLDIEKIDKLDPAFINLGSMKFYSGGVRDGLIYHFGGEDFRPPDFVSKKEIPNSTTADFNGKSIVITPYRGMGDSMILSRFIPKFMAKWPEAKITIATEPSMVPLYKNIPNIKVGTSESCAGKMFDHCLGVNMLSRYLKDQLVDENDNITYHEWVAYPESYDEKWKDLVSTTNPVIGVNWKGSQRLGGGGKSDRNLTRDVPFEEFHPIIDLFPNITFVTLNNDITDEEREVLSQKKNVIIPSGVKDFGDTAAIIKLCTLVVSVDTSISTLSASMSKDTTVMAKFWPDYRWLYYQKWWDLTKLRIDVYRKATAESSWAGVLMNVIKRLKEFDAQ